MKRCILLLALIFGFQLTMTAQKSKSNQASPKEDIHVNREFDKNGNLIKFDSVYGLLLQKRKCHVMNQSKVQPINPTNNLFKLNNYAKIHFQINGFDHF